MSIRFADIDKKEVKAKANGMSEDDQKMWADEVQEMTDKTIALIDKMVETKTAEIMQV